MTLAIAITNDKIVNRALRVSLDDVMKYEILINEKSKIWIFHDQVFKSRLAWVEFDPVTGTMDLIPHDMSTGILYANVPPALHARIHSADMVYFYLTDGDKVTGFQKTTMHVRRCT